jgi:hypothetical protein
VESSFCDTPVCLSRAKLRLKSNKNTQRSLITIYPSHVYRNERAVVNRGYVIINPTHPGLDDVWGQEFSNAHNDRLRGAGIEKVAPHSQRKTSSVWKFDTGKVKSSGMLEIYMDSRALVYLRAHFARTQAVDRHHVYIPFRHQARLI